MFLTGGDSTGDQYMWGINENGGLVYQRGSGMSTPVGVGSQTITRGSYTNIAIGVDSSELHVWLNGSKVLDSDAGYSTKLAGTNGFSFGASSARTFGGTDWVENKEVEWMKFEYEKVTQNHMHSLVWVEMDSTFQRLLLTVIQSQYS